MKVYNVDPGFGDLGISGAKLLLPGDPTASIFRVRHASTDPLVRMPPLATSVVNNPAIAAFDAWISSPGVCAGDDLCTSYGDCCDDYAAICGRVNLETCVGSCDGQSAGECYCGDLCTFYGDCCDDYAQRCL